MGDIGFLISYYLGELHKHRWMIVALTWIVLAIGVYAMAAVPDTFRSKAVVFINTDSLLATLVQGSEKNNPLRKVQQVRRMMYARPMIEELIRRSDLDLEIQSEKELDELVEEMEGKIEVEPQLSNFYQISFEHEDPVVARNVVKNLLTIFIESNLEQSSGGTEETLAFLEKQRDDLNGQLKDLVEELADYQRQYPDEIEDFRVIVSRRTSLDAELRQLRTERLLTVSQLEQMQQDLVVTPKRLESLVGGVASTHRQRYQALITERDTLLAAGKTVRHPDVIALERLIGQARFDLDNLGDYDEEADSVIYEANPAYRTLEANIKQNSLRLESIDKKIEEAVEDLENLQRAFERQPEIKFRYDALVERADYVKSRVVELTDNINRAALSDEVTRGTSVVDFQIIEPPVVPKLASGPDRSIGLTTAFVASLILPIGLAVILIATNTRLPTLLHLSNEFDLPILGAISDTDKEHAGAYGGVMANIGLIAIFLAYLAAMGAVYYIYVVAGYRPGYTMLREFLGSLL